MELSRKKFPISIETVNQFDGASYAQICEMPELDEQEKLGLRWPPTRRAIKSGSYFGTEPKRDESDSRRV